MSDYVLLLDADMIFYPNENSFSKKMLTFDIYYILQGSNDFYYKNVRIVKNFSKRRDYGSWLEATSTTRSRGSTRDMRQKACKSCGISAFYGQERRFEDR